MHGTTRAHAAAARIPLPGPGTSAVVWLGHRRALVLRDAGPDAHDEAEVELPDAPAATPVALAAIAHRIGPVKRVLVLGSDDMRTALERELVAIGHAPETIREGAVDGPVDRDLLLERLRRLG